MARPDWQQGDDDQYDCDGAYPTGEDNVVGWKALCGRLGGMEATDIVHELSGGNQPRDNIYVNVVHTLDGAWNGDGKAMTIGELGQVIHQDRIKAHWL